MALVAGQAAGTERWGRFALVGLFGIGVQTLVLLLLTRYAGWLDLPATALAVEVTIVHNFLWHERWTWSARAEPAGWPGRLLRFHVSNGLVSIAGNLVLTALFSSAARLPVVPANLLAIASMSIANYFVADRWVFQQRNRRLTASTCGSFVIAIGLLGVSSGSVDAAEPKLETIRDWNRYVVETECRLDREHGPNYESMDVTGVALPIPSGTIHDWQGSVFIPGVSLDEVFEAVKHPEADRRRQPEVLEAAVLNRHPDSLLLYLRLVRREIVSVTYDTEHEVRFLRYSPAAASSRSVATRIAEIEDAGTAGERMRPAEDDRGFMWRLNSYWRYEQVPGGVRVNMRSLTLSRDVPALIRPLAMPIVNRIARYSMVRTLESFKSRFDVPIREAQGEAVAPRSTP